MWCLSGSPSPGAFRLKVLSGKEIRVDLVMYEHVVFPEPVPVYVAF